MESDLAIVDRYLERTDADGYLLEADSTASDQRYLSGFEAPDPFVTLYTPDGLHLLVAGLEYNRAVRESRADTVHRNEEYGGEGRIRQYGRPENSRMLERFLGDFGVGSVCVPSWFPVGTADGLRDRGVAVEPETTGLLTRVRARKSPAEVDHIRRAQRANEAAMRAVEDLLRAATPDDSGRLMLDGDVLTSERVKAEMEVTLVHERCGLDEAVVAGGVDAADPHERGSGPLPAGEPIIVDIFPRDKATGYYADMTRTFAVGEPREPLREWYDLTGEALDAALGALEPGVTGAAVHDAACDVYEAAGYRTLRTHPETDTGFVHRTGHGIGLDVHEDPRLSPKGGELEAGHVVTVEPGLYDPDVGGVRIEDLVVVTEDGHENLTDYPRQFVVDGG